MTEAKNLGAPYELVVEIAQTGKLPVPNFSAGGSHAPYFDNAAGAVSISTGSIRTQELFYRSGDATCCPSGHATIVWSYNGHTFLPTTTVQGTTGAG